MKKKQLTVLMTAIALFAAPLFMTQSQAFNLGGALGKLTGKVKTPSTPAKPIAGNTKQAFSGRVLLPDGSPADNAKIYGCVDMQIRKESSYWTLQSASDSNIKPSGSTLEDGTFQIGATLGLTVSLVIFKPGYEPIIVKNVTSPVNLPNLQFTQRNENLRYVQYGWFDQSKASPF